ncbi:MAG: M13 family metallopeptidase [Atopobiaceae bacterium]|nr:M13 family metallopeptidase [Atopobiaceae bacterium]
MPHPAKATTQKPNERQFKRIVAMVLALVMTVSLVACGGGAGGNSLVGDESASQSASIAAEASSELAGKPWVTSIVQGNLPTERPEAKDDLYTHYAYEYIAAHQEQPGDQLEDYATELKSANLAAIKDDSKTGHDLDQLRIFFNQAADVEKLKEIGLSEVQPYLDRIDAVNSIEEMNELLLSKDFPFSPFLVTALTTSDTREVNIVAINPNLVLSDPLLVGGTYYQDSDDPQKQESIDRTLLMMGTSALVDLSVQGMETDEVMATYEKIKDFEKPYAKYLDYSGKHSAEAFGAAAESVRASYITPDDLYAACPNFPMKAMLKKLGMDGSPLYNSSPGWVEAFNEKWTNENLDVIKQIASLKVLNETRPYRDPSGANEASEQAGQPAPDAESFAYSACDSMDTFSIVLGNTYVNETLGTNAKERLTKLSQDIVNTYKDLVSNTAWVGEESRARVIEKLDHMALNVLEPTGGYYDFGGLELTPTDKGGTLLGNYLKLKQYRQDQTSKMVGQPAVPGSLWFSIKPTLNNAFYDSTSNSINICPGYVTSLVYSDEMSDASILAGIGTTIGHEISHGFDYAGAQQDAYGVPNPVFTDADVDAFVKKSSDLAAYYGGIEVLPGLMVDGDTVKTEAAADLCGMQAALELAGKSEGVDYDEFFSTYSLMWAQTVSADTLPYLLLDAHPLNNVRANVSTQMFDPIYENLGVKEGDGMYLAPDKRINVWGPNA